VTASPDHDAQPLDRNGPLPLWAQLEAELRRRIAAGHFVDRFLTDRELVDTYGVSRHTAREAVDRLIADGMIERRRGQGSFVVEEAIEQRLGSLYSLFASVEAEGLTQRSTVLQLGLTKDPAAAAHLGVTPATSLVHLARVRWAGEEPLALDRTWLPAEIALPLLTTDFSRTALYTQLEEQCGVRMSGGWERIQPVLPAPDEQELLRTGPQDAAFLIERLGRDAQGRTVEWRVSLVRGDRFRLVADWSNAMAAEPVTEHQP
jgi:GntR family transcriptional regulator